MGGIRVWVNPFIYGSWAAFPFRRVILLLLKPGSIPVMIAASTPMK